MIFVWEALQRTKTWKYVPEVAMDTWKYVPEVAMDTESTSGRILHFFGSGVTFDSQQ